MMNPGSVAEAFGGSQHFVCGETLPRPRSCDSNVLKLV